MRLRQISGEFNIRQAYDIGHLATRQWSEVSERARALIKPRPLENICN